MTSSQIYWWVRWRKCWKSVNTWWSRNTEAMATVECHVFVLTHGVHYVITELKMCFLENMQCAILKKMTQNRTASVRKSQTQVKQHRNSPFSRKEHECSQRGQYTANAIWPSYYASAPKALSDAFVWRLSVAYIGPNSRTERPRKTIIGTEVAHVTRDSDTGFKVKGQLVADVLNSQHAGIGATWRINTKILSTCRGGGISWRPPTGGFKTLLHAHTNTTTYITE